ncbi:hypothetical protein BD779DRAFT_1541917 [Infundibulicybe gibba]|nr:hypothetical protein BD779DRAFT_1541917 [Infundibulicybe gibba]
MFPTIRGLYNKSNSLTKYKQRLRLSSAPSPLRPAHALGSMLPIHAPDSGAPTTIDSWLALGNIKDIQDPLLEEVLREGAMKEIQRIRTMYDLSHVTIGERRLTPAEFRATTGELDPAEPLTVEYRVKVPPQEVADGSPITQGRCQSTTAARDCSNDSNAPYSEEQAYKNLLKILRELTEDIEV